MANKEATLILRIKEAGSAAIKNVSNQLKGLADSMKSSAIGNAASSLSSFGSAALGIVAPIGAAIASVGAIVVGLGKLAISASAVKEVETAFKNLATSQGQVASQVLENMKRMSAGTISDMELMKQANQAAMLGLPIDRFGEMLNIARSSAKATGQSMEFMLQSIVTGLGRGSKLMLDNLGIMIDAETANKKYAEANGLVASKLTEAEKKQAFLNEALRIGTANANASGAATVSLGDEWEKAKTTIVNWAAAIGSTLIPAFATTLGWLNNIADQVSETFKGMGTETHQADLLKLQKEYEKWHGILERNPGSAMAKENLSNLQKQINKVKELAQAETDALITDQQKVESAKIKNEAIAQEQAAHDAKMAEMDIAAKEAKKIRDEEDRLIDTETKAIHDEEDMLRLQENLAIRSEVERQARLADLNESIVNATSREEQLRLIRQKGLIEKMKIEANDKDNQMKIKKWEQMTNDEKVSATQETLGQIRGLTESNNKGLVAIGKAAGIAQIIVSTQVGAMRAYEQLGPILGGVAAGLIYTAGAVSAAKVAGVALAEGGIVRATNGGVPAIIGEGGKDEAVIPLDDDRASGILGGGNTYNFNGPILGSKDEAMQFAKWVDQGLLELRRNNESVAFDEGLT